MARKSRYTQGDSLKNQTKRWKTALYMRISREDGDKEESDSIQNQRIFLQNYLERDPELELCGRYLDDGYSGTNFDRPQFGQMMEKIRAKEINCVVVKDLSRFGRNYIEVGKYIEQIFPFLNVRFISVNDLLDSYQNPQSMNNLVVPFKNIINDEYCRDISNKVRSTLDRKRRDGKFIGSFACYGYQKDPDDKNHLLVDEDAAPVVRDIFRWHVEGLSVIGITRKLNALGILNPSAYKRRQGARYRHTSGEQNDTLWNDRTVRRILHSQMYRGNLVQGVSRVRSYKVQKLVGVPEEDWIIVENTHEAIIEQELFDKVQSLLERDTRAAPQSGRVYLFSGFLRCADCGKAMVKKNISQPYRDYIYYNCATYKKVTTGACTKHTIRSDELESAVLTSIQKQVELAVEMDELIAAINRSPVLRQKSGRLEHALEEKRQELERVNGFKCALYEDWKSGELTREEYREMKANYEMRAEQLTGALEQLEREQRQTEAATGYENAFVCSFKKHRNIQTLTREILTELVDCILVHEGKRITLRFRFADEYQKARAFIEQHEKPQPGGEKSA